MWSISTEPVCSSYHITHTHTLTTLRMDTETSVTLEPVITEVLTVVRGEIIGTKTVVTFVNQEEVLDSLASNMGRMEVEGPGEYDSN